MFSSPGNKPPLLDRVPKSPLNKAKKHLYHAHHLRNTKGTEHLLLPSFRLKPQHALPHILAWDVTYTSFYLSASESLMYVGFFVPTYFIEFGYYSPIRIKKKEIPRDLGTVSQILWMRTKYFITHNITATLTKCL